MDKYTGYAVLDYPWEDKNGCNSLADDRRQLT